MKHKISTPALAAILVLLAGFVFPLIFSVTDRLLRELFSSFHPTLLLLSSFAWLLFMYYFGITFSVQYLQRQFIITDKQRLIRYSSVGFTLVTLLLYISFLSPSTLSNMIWGCFYLCTFGIFYFLSNKHLN